MEINGQTIPKEGRKTSQVRTDGQIQTIEPGIFAAR
jgi:hypothetical protein